jgi:hypothetical protein
LLHGGLQSRQVWHDAGYVTGSRTLQGSPSISGNGE